MKNEFPCYQKKKRVNGRFVTLKEEIIKDMDEEDIKPIKVFVKKCASTACPRSVKKVERCMYQIYDVIEHSLQNLDLEILTDFAIVLKNSENIRIETKNDIRGIFKRFLRFQYEEVDKDFDKLSCLKKENRDIEQRVNENTLLTTEEIKLLIETADKIRYKTLIILLFESGARTEEIRKSKWGSINFEKNTLSLFSSKTSRARTIPINESIFYLEKYKRSLSNISDNDFIFPNPRDRSKAITDSGMSTFISTLGKRAGISRPIFPYLFRHTRLTQIYTTLPDPLAKQFSGHSPTSTVGARYTHFNNDVMVKAVEKQIYKTEEMPEEKKHELEIRMENMQKDFEEKMKNMMEFNKMLNKRMIETPEVFQIVNDEICESVESQFGLV